MKKVFIFFLVVVSLSQTHAMPATETSVVDIKETSDLNRKNKNFGLLYNTGTYGPVLMAGLSLTYFLNANNQLELTGFGGSSVGDSIVSSIFGNKLSVSVSGSRLMYRHFLSNSAFVRAGLDYRNVNYKEEYRNLFTGDYNSSIQFRGESVSLIFGIGNEWQWSNFTLGCDWVGVSIPITKNIKTSEIITDASDVNFYKEDIDKNQKRYLSDNWIYALNLRIGATF